MRILTHFDLCTGCLMCQLACSETKWKGYNPRLGLLDVSLQKEGLIHQPTVCAQCTNPYCQRVCPVDAIKRDEAAGALNVDGDICTSCGLCRLACPIDMVKTDPYTEKAVKCDLCGGEPSCVKICPTGALEVV